MNKYVLGIIILLIILAGVYLWQNNSNSNLPTVDNTETEITDEDQGTTEEEGMDEGDEATQEEPAAPSESEEAVVTYTADGYLPAVVRVSPGTTVVFQNDSGQLMWTASAVHPTHQMLPGFDSLQGVASGGSYSFTFDEAGNWSYHNHLRANHTGQIIVE